MLASFFMFCSFNYLLHGISSGNIHNFPFLNTRRDAEHRRQKFNNTDICLWL